MTEAVRAFTTGATRDKDQGKLDFEGFLSPRVLAIFGQYMHRNRKTAAGFRESDNWQKGMPLDAYMKSMWRHFFDVWAHHRGEVVETRFDEDGLPLPPETVEDALAGLMFNVMGYLFEVSRPENQPLPGLAELERKAALDRLDAAVNASAGRVKPFGEDGWCDCMPTRKRCDCDGLGGGGKSRDGQEGVK